MLSARFAQVVRDAARLRLRRARDHCDHRHKSVSDVSRYTEAAEQAKLAEQAMARLSKNKAATEIVQQGIRRGFIGGFYEQ
jgi:hypothetical protein